jgi:hypothetical protein
MSFPQALHNFTEEPTKVEEVFEHVDYVTWALNIEPTLAGVTAPHCLKFFKGADGDVLLATKALSTSPAFLPANGMVVLTKADMEVLKASPPLAAPQVPAEYTQQKEMLRNASAKGLVPDGVLDEWNAWWEREEAVDTTQCETCTDLRHAIRVAYTSKRQKQDNLAVHKAQKTLNTNLRNELRAHQMEQLRAGDDVAPGHRLQNGWIYPFIAPGLRGAIPRREPEDVSGSDDGIEIVQPDVPLVTPKAVPKAKGRGKGTTLAVGQVAAFKASEDQQENGVIWLGKVLSVDRDGESCQVQWLTNTSRTYAMCGPFKPGVLEDTLPVSSIISTGVEFTLGLKIKDKHLKVIAAHPLMCQSA